MKILARWAGDRWKAVKAIPDDYTGNRRYTGRQVDRPDMGRIIPVTEDDIREWVTDSHKWHKAIRTGYVEQLRNSSQDLSQIGKG